jgi:hypothetical protein
LPLAASASPAGPASPTPGAGRSSTPDPTASPVPTPTTEASFAAACLPLPHDDEELEAIMPATVGGRPLAIWSVHGERMVTCIQGGAEADVRALEAALADEDLGLDDLSVVIAGRSDTGADPPYFVFAYRLTGSAGSEFPDSIGLDYPDRADFRDAVIAGKDVIVGEPASMEQTDHARGRPYVWNSPTVHYLIITDDEAWAADALRQLR